MQVRLVFRFALRVGRRFQCGQKIRLFRLTQPSEDVAERRLRRLRTCICYMKVIAADPQRALIPCREKHAQSINYRRLACVVGANKYVERKHPVNPS